MKLSKLSIIVALVFVVALASITVLAEEPQYGGTFVFGRSGDSVGLDPIQVTDGESFKVTQQIYDPIVMYEPGSTDVIPGLAEKWDVSDDVLTWTFYLRKDAYFHDGTSVNAEAIKFNFDRWRLPNHPYHIGGDFTYYGYMFQDFPGIIQEVNVVDEYIVEFVLSEPQAPFLNNLAMVSFGISSPTAVKKWGEDYFKHPVGSGPFKFVEWVKDDRVVLVANEDYWGGRPYLDKVIFRSIPDNGARYMELQAGTIDMMDYINPEDVESVKNNPGLDLILRPSFNVGYFSMNQNFEPFDNVKVRRALNHAFNKETLIGAFYAGLAEPAKNPLPPSLWGYNDDIEDYKYDLEKAKQLLAEAGYPNGFEFDLWYMPVARPYFPQPKMVAQAMQYYFGEIGVTANLKSVDWGTYLDMYYADELPTYLLGWTGDNGDPDNFLYVLIDPTQNNFGYENDELHQILLEAQRTVDKERRIELYMEAQEIIHDDAVWVPVAHSTPPLVKKTKVKNYIPNPTSTEKFHEVWLDQ